MLWGAGKGKEIDRLIRGAPPHPGPAAQGSRSLTQADGAGGGGLRRKGAGQVPRAPHGTRLVHAGAPGMQKGVLS